MDCVAVIETLVDSASSIYVCPRLSLPSPFLLYFLRKSLPLFSSFNSSKFILCVIAILWGAGGVVGVRNSPEAQRIFCE